MKVHSRSSNGTPLFERVCKSCGKTSVVDRRRVNNTCLACANRSRSTHGLAASGNLHPLYKLIHNIRSRCTNPSASNFKYYGGRGISVCDEWTNNTVAFVEWASQNGWRPGLEIDRINHDGNYTPENCQFITHKQNSRKTRRSKTTEAQAKLVKSMFAEGASVNEAAVKSGVSYMSAWHIRKGNSWDDV